MKRFLKIIAVVLFLAFVAVQFVRPDLTNPPVDQSQTLFANVEISSNVQAILRRSCADCHSNETQYPWYARIQPSASFLKNHIDDGRKELNISEWGTYPPAKQRRKLAEICEQVEAKEMPLPSYLWIHWSAKMSDEDVKTLCAWTDATRAKMPE